MNDKIEEAANEEERPAEDPIEAVEISEAARQMADADMESENSSADEPLLEETPAAEPTPEEQVAEMKDRLLRALADVENTRRRATRDLEDSRKYGASNFAKDLLNVADNLRRALDSVTDELRDSGEASSNLVSGIEMVEQELLSSFERHGITKIDPLGELFNHDFHQAMFEIESEEYSAGTVAQVLQPGYVMHDRLLRPAMVAVAKAASEEPPEDVAPVDTTA